MDNGRRKLHMPALIKKRGKLMRYEEQYRQAVLKDSVVVYQVNVSRDRIEEEFAQKQEGK